VTSAAASHPERPRWIALAVCCSALFMTLLDLSITNVALPSIGEATGAGPAQLQWVVSGYTLAFGLVPVLAGRLGDDHGRRLMFIVGVAGFVVTSALSGLAPNPEILIVARVLQGLCGGLINPQVSGLVQQLFQGRDRGRAFGVIGTVVALGTALGPVVGGLIIALGGEDFGWRLVFFINIPIGIAVIVMARRWLPDTPATGQHTLDFVGAGVLGLATFCVLFSAVEYDAVRDTRLFLLIVPALVLLLVFFRREARLTHENRDPLVDLRLFRQPSFTAGVALAIVFFSAMVGIPLVLALYYQLGLGYTALESGLGITAYALGSAIAAPLAGRVVTRIGRPLLVGACVTFGIGALALDAVARQHPDEQAALVLAVPLFVLGLGAGAVITPNQTLTLIDVDPVTGSTAGGVLQTSQRIGAAIGQAVVGAAFFAALPAAVDDLTGSERSAAFGDALGQAIMVSLLFVAAALAVGIIDLVLTRRRRTTSGGSDADRRAQDDAPVTHP
jgi:EmrB/QacA subfamily drug resistance transporter